MPRADVDSILASPRRLRVVRAGVAVWMAGFVWWCVRGAPGVFVAKSYGDAATWVQALSFPWVAVGIGVGCWALWAPTWLTLSATGMVTVIHLWLVFTTW